MTQRKSDPAWVEARIAQIKREKAEFRAPRDKAVFYTGGGQPEAIAHCRREDAVTLEGVKPEQWFDLPPEERKAPPKVGAYGTRGGARLEAECLFDVRHEDDAKRVWGAASGTYAEQARGRATLVVGPGGISETSFFARHESPALAKNREVEGVDVVFVRGPEGIKDEVLFSEKGVSAALKNPKVETVNGVPRAEMEALMKKGPEGRKEILSRFEEADRKRLEHNKAAGTADRKSAAATSSAKAEPPAERKRTAEAWGREAQAKKQESKSKTHGPRA